MAQKKKFEYSQYAGFVQVLKFAQQFSSPGKSLENIHKVFLKVTSTISALQYWIFLFRAGQILFNLTCMFAAHHGKSFVPSVFKVSIDHLFDNRESGSKNLYEPWIGVWPPMTFWLLVQMLYH